MLWGTTRQNTAQEMSSVLATVALDGVTLEGTPIKGMSLEKGVLAAPGGKPEELVGAIFQGAASDGTRTEVAVCSAEPVAQDPSVLSYRIEIWDKKKESWENPCIANSHAPKPKALALKGLWDKRGAHQDKPGTFTFACENGVIAKCVHWGYKPWDTKDGQPLQALHQACTRMARADYCGNGRSHTREDNIIDLYDAFGIQARTTTASAHWNPSKISFEAAWGPDGASCLARTREGQALEAILKECPGRFETGAKDLGEGDQCQVRRKSQRTETALLRNQSYDKERASAAASR
ncbi:hypothetical protein SAMN05444354_107162 [Stigmatella aurantiaca]|uniref:ADYC domain-containing protein n=1 Tax=Stigmatella aurantiaca TaxID=41 RepID=A0A1H7RSB0_STIAU|nr:ADYC domain-containing protein [Stigmatella aurantiaca]SEL63096.1 hypothetical protein SAMN05444354_107162 [Stigmatella aurantiaca]